MKVIFLRHASRSAQGLGDSALNAVGHSQAETLPHMIAPQGSLPVPTHLISSPKRRAKETLTPISKTLAVQLHVDARLDERHQNETGQEFETRVNSLLEELSEFTKKANRDTVVWLCSHLDWLELAMAILPSDMTELEAVAPWSNAQYRIFKLEDGIWRFSGTGVANARR